MATVRTINRLIRAVLSDILNVYNPEETIEAADAKTVKEAIEDRLAAWAGLVTIPVVSTDTFAMVVGTASYTIGETGAPTLNAQRPEQIIGAYIHEGDYDYPVKIWTEKQYRGIADKTTRSRPTALYPKYDTPNVTVYLYPTPDSTDNIYIQSVKIYTEPTTYVEDTFVTLGIPGIVYNALKWRVSIDVAVGFGKEATQTMMYNASESYNDMIAQNLARSLVPAQIELAYLGQPTYSLEDFYAGE